MTRAGKTSGSPYKYTSAAADYTCLADYSPIAFRSKPHA